MMFTSGLYSLDKITRRGTKDTWEWEARQEKLRLKDPRGSLQLKGSGFQRIFLCFSKDHCAPTGILLPTQGSTSPLCGGGGVIEREQGVIFSPQHLSPPLPNFPPPILGLCGTEGEPASSGEEEGWKGRGREGIRASTLSAGPPPRPLVWESRPAVSDSFLVAAPPEGVEDGDTGRDRARPSPGRPSGQLPQHPAGRCVSWAASRP